jgi:hypothetical protein
VSGEVGQGGASGSKKRKRGLERVCVCV